MKSILTKVVLMISVIITLVIVTLLFSVQNRTKDILDADSDEILVSVADFYESAIDDNFRSAEQSVGTIYNYAINRAKDYPDFLEDAEQRQQYTEDVSVLAESIAENTVGSIGVYMRYNPDTYGTNSGFLYTLDSTEGVWEKKKTTDMSLYDEDDMEHVGWYYIPVQSGHSMWMDSYYNANRGTDIISYIIPFFYNNSTVGVIGMDISVDTIRQAAAGIHVYETGEAFILQEDGTIVYHSSYPDGMDIEDLGEDEISYINMILSNESDTAFVIDSQDGTKHKVVLKNLINGMILGVYAPVDEIGIPQKNLMDQLIKIFFIVFILAIFAGVLMARTFVKPLKQMTAVAERYAKGDFTENIRVNSKDEIGKLSNSLDVMSTYLKDQLNASDSANRAKGEFLANMSHEIRTPINAILGMDEMIIRESKDEQIVEYAVNIKQAGRSLLAQVNSILDYSKLEDGKMEVFPEEYDLAQLINTSANNISTRAKVKGLNFKTDIDENLPVTLLGDDLRLGQIIMNLLTNAIKYTQAGSIVLTMKDVGRNDKDINIFVSVEDTGIGIKEEDLERLSISFQRFDEEKNRNIEGTGLGIPIVMKLLTVMGSKLKVESTYGQGSTFSFVVNQGIVNDEPIGDYKKRVKKDFRKRSKYTYPSMPTASILLVDDYEMNLMVAKNLMKIYDFEPDLVGSGKEAITRIEEKHYDIVFMDHMMPGMDGIETLEYLKDRNLIGDNTKVVALTANAIAGAKEYYKSKGFDDYLTKPIDADQLEDMLVKYVPAKKIIKKSISDLKKDKSLVNSDEERKALMKIFVSTIDETGKKLQELLEAEDIKNYTIKVHGLKSTARLIGEVSISNKAEKLEMAGKAGDWDYIKSHHESLMKEYLSVRDNFQEDKPKKKKLEDSDLKDGIYSIIEMANVCDYTSTEMVLNSLDEYEMDQELTQQIKEIRSLLEKLDYEAVANMAKEML